MLNIEVRFSLPLAYQNPFVSLHGREHVVTFRLEAGTHVAQSSAVDIGTLHRFEDRRLLGQFRFEYTYEPEQRLITVCGTDFDSSRSMCLTTVPDGTKEYCHQYAAGGGFRAENLGANPHWNYLTPLTPGLKDLFGGVVRTVNDRVIEALKKQPKLSVQIRKHPPEMSAEDYRKLLLVYRDGRFLGFHEEGRKYGPGDELVTVESVFGGLVHFSYAESVANVIGSTNDPKIASKTWIQLWVKEFDTDPVICASYQFDDFNCNDTIVGGHVITGTQAKVVAKGSNAVYILPICQAHNTDNNVYMQCLKYLDGVWLKNYLGP